MVARGEHVYFIIFIITVIAVMLSLIVYRARIRVQSPSLKWM